MASETSESIINNVVDALNVGGGSDEEGILDKLTKVFNENKTYIIIAGIVVLLGILTLWYLSMNKETPQNKPKIPIIPVKINKPKKQQDEEEDDPKPKSKPVKKLVHADDVSESSEVPPPRKHRKKTPVSSESESEKVENKVQSNDLKQFDLTNSELEDINNQLGKIKPE